MDQSFTEKEGMDLIRQMIDTAKNNLQKGIGRVFLLWGYLVAAISLSTCILLIVLPGDVRYGAYYLWFLMMLGYPVHYIMIRRMDQTRVVTTYIERMMAWVWIAFSISMAVVVAGLLLASFLITPAFAAEGSGYDFLHWFQWLFLPPFMLCLYGVALFISGKAYDFIPLVTGGIICWAATLFLLVFLHHPNVLEIQQAALCLCALAGFVIPGHLLQKKEQTHV